MTLSGLVKPFGSRPNQTKELPLRWGEGVCQCPILGLGRLPGMGPMPASRALVTKQKTTELTHLGLRTTHVAHRANPLIESVAGLRRWRQTHSGNWIGRGGLKGCSVWRGPVSPGKASPGSDSDWQAPGRGWGVVCGRADAGPGSSLPGPQYFRFSFWKSLVLSLGRGRSPKTWVSSASRSTSARMLASMRSRSGEEGCGGRDAISAHSGHLCTLPKPRV